MQFNYCWFTPDDANVITMCHDTTNADAHGIKINIYSRETLQKLKPYSDMLSDDDSNTSTQPKAANDSPCITLSSNYKLSAAAISKTKKKILGCVPGEPARIIVWDLNTSVHKETEQIILDEKCVQPKQIALFTSHVGIVTALAVVCEKSHDVYVMACPANDIKWRHRTLWKAFTPKQSKQHSSADLKKPHEGDQDDNVVERLPSSVEFTQTGLVAVGHTDGVLSISEHWTAVTSSSSSIDEHQLQYSSFQAAHQGESVTSVAFCNDAKSTIVAVGSAKSIYGMSRFD